MGKASKYSVNNDPSISDLLFGFKDGKEQNVPIEAIINILNSVAGKDYIQYKFSPSDFISVGSFTSNESKVNPAEITKLFLNKKSTAKEDLSVLFNKLDTLQNIALSLRNPSDSNNFVTFKVTNITTHTDYFEFDVVVFKGFYSGNLLSASSYSLYFDVKENFEDKTDKGGFTGTAEDLNTDIQTRVEKVTGKSLVSDTEITKLSHLDDTTDLQKPVSTAQQAAIDAAVQAQIVDSTLINGVTESSSVPPTGNIHAIGVGEGTYPYWGGMVIPANNIGTLSRVGGVYSVSLTAIVLADYSLKTDIQNNINSIETDKALSANQGKVLNEKIVEELKHSGLGSLKTLGSTTPSTSETSYSSTQKYFIINDLTAASKSNVNKIKINHGAVGIGVSFYVAVVKITGSILVIKKKIKLTTTGTNSVQEYVVDLKMEIGDKIAISNTDKLAKFDSGTGGGYFDVNLDFSLGDSTSSNLEFGVEIDAYEINNETMFSKIEANTNELNENNVYNLDLDFALVTDPVETITQAFANLSWIDYCDAVKVKIHKSGSNTIRLYKINHGNTINSLIEEIDISRYNEGEVVTIVFKNKIVFEKGEYLALSANLYYRTSGGSGVIRIQGIGTSILMVDDNNDLNIGFQLIKFPTKINYTPILKLKGKKLSILGDSISTYEGYIPAGNEKFYPRLDAPEMFDVDSVEKTWWKKLINETGLVLDVNNSWSGSKVSDGVNLNGEGVQRKAFVTDDRLNNLGNPDYLIIFGSTNDYGIGSDTILGSISKNPVDWNLAVFTHAYQYMVYTLQKKLPRTKIICCSPLQRAMYSESDIYPIKRWPDDLYLHQIRDRIEDITKLYGVKFVDLYSCGIDYFNSNNNPAAIGMTESIYLSDGLHPKEIGMDKIKDKFLEIF